MKLIEAMKNVKSILRKMEDIRGKVQKYCADLDIQSPTYSDQRGQIAQWLQSHHDLAIELTVLKKNIQRTNLYSDVTIYIGDKGVTRSIAEWVIRRREIVDLEVQCWAGLSNRGLSDVQLRTGSGDTTPAKVRLYFDAKERDANVELFKSEKESIDKALEIANATTSLIED